MKKIILFILALFVISSIPAITNCHTAKSFSFFKRSITDDEMKSIKYMREKEKLGRDFYEQMTAKYDIKPFKSIAVTKQDNMDALKDLLDKFSIEDPVKSNDPGTYTSEKLTSMYKRLTEKAEISQTDALKSGAEIEELDIKTLDTYISKTTNTDIKDEFTKLQKAAESNLKMFVNNLSNKGVGYFPVHLTSEEFNKILSGK